MSILSLSIAMQLIQYPGTFIYYRWRNSRKAKKWNAMTAEEQHEYRTNTTDVGNKRYPRILIASKVPRY